jgi:DNA repair exonuclease SbcCD ATPase subunit
MSSLKQQSDAEKAIAAKSDNRSNLLRNHDEGFSEFTKKRNENDMAIWKQSRDRMVALEMSNSLRNHDEEFAEFTKKRNENDMAIWKQSRDRVVALEMENADLKKKNQIIEQEATDLRNGKETSEKQAVQYREGFKKNHQITKEYRKKIDTLKEKVTALRKEHKALNGKNNEYHETIDVLKKDAETLKLTAKRLKRSNENFKEEENTSIGKKKLKKKVNDLTEEIETLKRSQVNATKEIKTAKDLLRAGGALLVDDDDVAVPGRRTHGQEPPHNALRDNAVLEKRVKNYENATNSAIGHLNQAFAIVLDE